MQRVFAISFLGEEKVFPKVMPSADPEVKWQLELAAMQLIYSITLKISNSTFQALPQSISSSSPSFG